MKMKLISFILLLSMLTGCAGSAGETASEEAAIKVNAATDAVPTAANSQSPQREYKRPEMKGEITVSVLDDNEFVNTAAASFMERYPDVTVTVHAFRNIAPIEMEGGMVMSGRPTEEQSVGNYLSLLNTQIMSGNADDIIMTDDIPYRKYTEMGVFADLSPFLAQSPEINEESHYMNVFELMKEKDGALYEIPLTWNVSQIYAFHKDLVEDSGLYLDDSIKSMSYADAIAHAKKLVDNTNRVNTFLDLGSAANTAYMLVAEDIDKFVDMENKKVDINNTQFIEILNYAKELQEQGYYDSDRTIDFYNMEYYFALTDDMGFQAAYFALMPDSERYHSMPLSDKEGNVSFKAYPRFGINGASPNKELAWEFIKFLLSDEMQTSPSLYGLGVNKKGFDAFVDQTFGWYGEGNGTDIVTKQDYTALIGEWWSQVNSYVRHDSMIMDDFLYQEIASFAIGAQSAEETAQILQSKLDKYLNE